MADTRPHQDRALNLGTGDQRSDERLACSPNAKSDHDRPAAACANLDARHGAVNAAERAWAAALAEHGVSPGAADLYRRALQTAIDDAARQLQAEQPEWLIT
jgi:hypothetical protein